MRSTPSFASRRTPTRSQVSRVDPKRTVYRCLIDPVVSHQVVVRGTEYTFDDIAEICILRAIQPRGPLSIQMFWPNHTSCPGHSTRSCPPYEDKRSSSNSDETRSYSPEACCVPPAWQTAVVRDDFDALIAEMSPVVESTFVAPCCCTVVYLDPDVKGLECAEQEVGSAATLLTRVSARCQSRHVRGSCHK